MAKITVHFQGLSALRGASSFYFYNLFNMRVVLFTLRKKHPRLINAGTKRVVNVWQITEALGDCRPFVTEAYSL